MIELEDNFKKNEKKWKQLYTHTHTQSKYLELINLILTNLKLPVGKRIYIQQRKVPLNCIASTLNLLAIQFRWHWWTACVGNAKYRYLFIVVPNCFMVNEFICVRDFNIWGIKRNEAYGTRSEYNGYERKSLKCTSYIYVNISWAK